jgi:predicted esterase
MSELDFSKTRAEITALYNRKDYAEALDLLTREAARYPQQGVMYNWKMCLAARVGKPSQAIQAFQEALDHGYSYPQRLLREDEDLASLQGLPEYEELATLSEQRFAQVQATTKPELLVIPANEASTAPSPLLIGLHGNSQSAKLAADDWRPLHAKGWTLALPQSSELLTSDAYMWNDFERGAAEVEAVTGKLIGEPTIDPGRIIIGGFSAGGGLAIKLAVTGRIPARGFLVVGPYLRDLDTLEPYLATARENQVKGYIIMGLQEPPEGQDLMQKTAAFLTEHGIPCEVERHPELAHAFPADFGASLQKALAFLL